ncbi:MAG: right-handed parallel beta-helix repeat-containing protein, partial [Candidatus Cloacimonadaceae bacterium]|nr:right-handed parallel beta-helix repeat-containing protein [Candidatus Cloacimonadaceae bacterium]
ATALPPGQYYVECELFQPGTVNFYYPKQSNAFTVTANTTLVNLPLLALTRYSFPNVLVSNIVTYPYFKTVGQALQRIQQAVNNTAFNGEPIRIQVMPGTYYESIDLSHLMSIYSFPIPSFTLEGTGGPNYPIINGGGSPYCINLGVEWMFTEDPNSVVNIINLRLTNAKQGIRFRDYELDRTITRMILNIRNCQIYQCGSSENSDYQGAGVYFEGTGSIVNTTISNNSMTNGSNAYGAIYANNNYSRELLIQGNTITNNTGRVCGAVGLSGKGIIRFTNNKLADNIPIGATETPGALWVFDAKYTKIDTNLMINNGAASVFLVAIGTIQQAISPIDFANNTIVNNTASIALSMWQNGQQSIKVSNNVFSSQTVGGSVRSVNFANPIVTYNVFHNTTALGFQISPTTNIIGNPSLDANYQPIWNATVMSPCIDKGNPDTNGNGILWNEDPEDRDPDGTPFDIGAIRAVDHRYEEYAMPVGNVSSGIKWMSFPALNTLTAGYTTNSSFFAPIIHQARLDWVTWKWENYAETTMRYEQGSIVNDQAIANSIQGYKVKVLDTHLTPISIKTSGFLQAPNTVINLYAYQSGSTTVANENWIGFFDRRSARSFDALAPILNFVTSIKTQYWSMHRLPGGTWFGGGAQVGSTFNYGDMVILTVSQNCSFTWNNNKPVDPNTRDLP